jgi:hypothetical protein
MTAEVKRLTKRIRELERRLAQAEVAELDHREVRRTIFKMAEQPVPPPRAWTAPPSRGSGEAGIPTLLISDWHYGETVAPGEAAGNRYNRNIAKQRLRNVADRAIDIITRHMTGCKPTTLVVGLLGDIVTGEIHEELNKTNDGPLLPAVLEAATELFHVLTYLQKTLDVNIICPCASGNHGRNTKRIEAKKFTASNFDWLIYTLLEKWCGLVGNERIRFINNDSNEAHWKLFDINYMALHGHDLGVRGGDGIIGPLGPIMRGRMKVVAQQRSLGRNIDTLVMGHWHQYITLPGIVVNGSIKGYDEFAGRVLRAPVAPAIQALWYTHPKHGITCHWPVFAE